MPLDPQLKALHPHSQSPGQVLRPQSGPIPVFNPAGKLVSGRPRCRSHSPSYRIDIDIEEDQGGWKKGTRPAVSSENLKVPSDWEVTAFDLADPLSQSFPGDALKTALPRQRNSYSPASGSGNHLQIPDKNHCISPASDRYKRRWRSGLNALGGSSSMCDLSASALADMLRQQLRTSNHLLPCSPTTPPPWLGLSPRTSPQISPSHSPTSSSSCSPNTLSPLFSPDYHVSDMAHESSTLTHTHLLVPNNLSYSFFISPAATPRCSPCGSPFGSQTQIYVGTEG